MSFALYTSTFTDRETIPIIYTCDGEDKSPKLSWSGEPHGTASFSLIMHDPDAPNGDFTHWIITDIPPDICDLEEGALPGLVGRDHLNSFGRVGYGGPCPPPGHGAHRYYFDLYAVDVTSLGLPTGSSREEIEAALNGHVIAKTLIVGTYERAPRPMVTPAEPTKSHHATAQT